MPRPWISHVLTLAGLLPLAPASQAAITVTGLADKSYYLDTVSFTIQNDAGYTFAATMDGASLGTAGTLTENRPGYHELNVVKTPTAGGAAENRTVRFIVKDGYRGGSSNTYPEAGLARWTPLRSVDAPGPVLDAAATFSIEVPSHLPAGFAMPVVARLTDGLGAPVRVIGTVDVSGAASSRFRLFRGAGSGVLTAPATAGSHTLGATLGSRTVQKSLTVNAAPAWQTIGGALSTQTFPPGSYLDVTADVTVAAGQTVTLGAGCVLRCAQGVEFDIQGILNVNGTASEPVIFGPAAGAVWGGVWIHGAGSKIQATHAFFTGGGADASWISSHSMHSHKSEEPLITWSNGATGTIEDCHVVGNPSGQSLHAEDSTFTVRRCLLQRAVSGGQIHNCNLTWEYNHLVEMPIDDTFVDGTVANADYDGLYCDGGTTNISHSVFGWCKDDTLDAGSGNTSNITVTDCWFESAVHEGMAWSEGGTRTVRDCVAINCGQGLECGFTGQGSGTPAVNALRVLSTGNLMGIRYGDNYNWSYSGKFDVHDSLSLFNGDDVFGIHWGQFVGGSTIDWNYVGSNRASAAYMHLEALPAQSWGATVVSVPQAEHPTLPTWDPSNASHLAMLAPLVPFPTEDSGFSVVDETRLFARSAFGGTFTVRLDRPVTVSRSIPWKLVGKASLQASAETILTTGALSMVAGRQAAPLTVPSLPGAGSYPVLSLVFDDSAGCVCTGNRSVTWADLNFPAPPTAPNPVTLFARSTTGWKYLAQGTAAPTTWADRTFADTAWSPSGTTATAPFQTAESSVGGTAVPGNASNSNLPFNTIYFRRSFTVADKSLFSSLTINCLRDDGVVIYLNGKEIKRDNMPATGTVGYNTSASSTINGTAETVWQTYTGLPVADLIDGTNVLAIELHQASITGTPPLTTSSDMRFDIELLGQPPTPSAPVYWEALPIANDLQLLWTDPNTVLQVNPDLDSHWRDLGASSPFVVRPVDQRMFFRLRRAD